MIFLKEKLGITWDQVAIRTKIPYRTLQGIVYSVTTNPRIKTVILLAKYFNLTLDELTLIDLSKTK